MDSVSSITPKASSIGHTAFTLVEVLIATAISGIVLAGVLTANLQTIRGGVRVTAYAEMESQVRRAFDTLGRDLNHAVTITWNGDSDITLTIPAGGTATAQVTYAWTAESSAFFRVAGDRSSVVAGRLELVRGVPPLADGSPGLIFARFDRDGVVARTDAATKSIQVTMTPARPGRGMAASSQAAVSTRFLMRCKPTS